MEKSELRMSLVVPVIVVIAPQDCLGGNSKTLIIANINPSPTCSSETSSTLHFAMNAKCVKNRVSTHITGTTSAHLHSCNAAHRYVSTMCLRQSLPC